MKSLYTAMCIVLMIGLNATGEEMMKNVFEDIPYTDGQMGKRQLVGETHLLVMQVALQPGQQVPPHNANSNVHLLIVEGQVIVTLDGKDTAAAIPVIDRRTAASPQRIVPRATAAAPA